MNVGPRIGLLRTLAKLRDMIEPAESDGWYPLFGAGEHPYDRETMLLAAREARDTGHIEAIRQTGADWHIFAYMIRLTSAGYDFIKAHDAIGEAEQEVTR